MEYITRFFAKHKMIYTTLILLVAICGTLLGCVLDMENQVKEIANQEEEKSEKADCQMFMAESLSDIAFYSYMEEGTDAFGQMQSLRNELEVNDNFTYIVQSDQWLEVDSPEMSEIFLVGYENGDVDGSVYEYEGHMRYAVKTLQVSASFFERYAIAVNEGEIFSKEDYQYQENQTVPVILGAAYQEFFELGDVIKANYLFENMQFQVIGFLDNTAFFYDWNGNEMSSCERYILMPAFLNLPENDFGKRALLQFFSAYIESDESFDETVEKIHGLMQENNVSEEDIYFVNPNEKLQPVNIMQSYSAMTGAVVKYFDVMIGVMLVSIGFILTIVLTNMIQEENYNFGIYIMCGMKRSRLAALIFMFDSVIIGSGDLIVIIILMMQQVSVRSILLVQVVVALILLASFAACYLRLRKLDIAELIGGKE